MKAPLAPLLLGCLLAIFPVAHAHTWLFTKGRAWLQASLDKPFRQRVVEAGQGTHAQLGPGQTMVVRWASSHNNTFSLAVVAASDQEWFYHDEFYTMLDDYIDSAPIGANEAIEKPRYHGAKSSSKYLNQATNTACAGGYCVEDLFIQELPTSHPEYVGHNLDMGSFSTSWNHHQYAYNPEIVHDEVSGTWQKIPDRRVSYVSERYPWLVSALRFHNKVNMHSEWDLVHLGLPARAHTEEHMMEKGQHYIVHFSSRSPTDRTYTDAVDVNALPTPVDPPELIYGSSSGTWGWSKTDHCQFVSVDDVVSPIRNATETVTCRADMESQGIQSLQKQLGMNVVPAVNPDVVPMFVNREAEEVDPLCLASCTPTPDDSRVLTAGYCRQATETASVAVCTSPARVHKVAWANPELSGISYDASTVTGAKSGDYISFEWDDYLHDVLLAPAGATDPCIVTSSHTEIIPPSHHATIDPETEDTVVEGRNLFRIPEDVAGTTLTFLCSVGTHCGSGMQLIVSIDSQPALPEPELAEGVCPQNYTLCPDQSEQTGTTATVKTSVNVPFFNSIATDSDALKLTGEATRAATPWESWAYRQVSGKRCRSRPQNTRVITNRPAAAGIDWGNKAVWEFPDHTLREVVEACSSSHPETCTGISWKGGGTLNYTLASPVTARTFSSARRDKSRINQRPGWIPRVKAKGQWMQLDLREDREVAGVVVQARGNNCCGPHSVTDFTVAYSSDGVEFTDVPGVFNGIPVDYMANEWAADIAANGVKTRQFKVFFPSAVTGRYVRIIVQGWYRYPALRAEALMYINNNMFTGKHAFRRCLETGGYTRLVHAGELTENESSEFTVPSNFTKSVDCPGCYQCREVPLAPWTEPIHKPYWGKVGFNPIVSNPGTADAVLTVSLPLPVNNDLSWENHNPEFICRVDSASAGTGPLEPDLEDDSGWMTFLLPSDPNNADAVIDAMAAGFQPPEAVRDFHSLDLANLAAVYPPGNQVDPSSTGPWHSRGWQNLTADSVTFTLPPQALDGSRGGGYWPPKPELKVTFMPVPVNEYYSRLYPRGKNYASMVELIAKTRQAGWHVDQGALESEQTNNATGETATFGWRCKPQMAWFQQNWNEHGNKIIPPYHYGAVVQVGSHFSDATESSTARCPDGQLNAWEATVPNGVYTVTVNFQSNGCIFENVRGYGKEYGSTNKDTHVYSVEVADGRFTLSSMGGSGCGSVNWLKLDLVSTTLFPAPWLPAPLKEWWQLKLDEPTAEIGLVEIRLPHQSHMAAATYPQGFEGSAPDCRKWWLYAPAKCYRAFMFARKYGIHPDLVSYPNFPGFTQPFLEWLFTQHDANGDGLLSYEEFRSSQSQQAKTGNYSMWSKPGRHNVKGTRGYHDDNAAHLWGKIDSMRDGIVTRSEFTHGILSAPRSSFCDMFESTEFTHGGNIWAGFCLKSTQGGVPDHFGYFPDDNSHGFVVSVSDTPCTNMYGCPTDSKDVTVCETRLDYNGDDKAAKVDCRGATGKYLQISLPGDGQRILPHVVVTPHRSSLPTSPGSTAATNPWLPSVCYGVVPRPLPAADASDLLAAAKLHPKIIVNDNPEDPIFWSTCYDRVVIKEWIPLIGESEEEAGIQYAFKNRTQCLACESVEQNYQTEYDITAMPTPRWWLQPEGSCTECITQTVMVMETVVMDGDYATMVTDKELFLAQCTEALLADGVECVDVRPGSIKIDIQGERLNVMAAMQDLQQHGLNISSFETLAMMKSKGGFHPADIGTGCEGASSSVEPGITAAIVIGGLCLAAIAVGVAYYVYVQPKKTERNATAEKNADPVRISVVANPADCGEVEMK